MHLPEQRQSIGGWLLTQRARSPFHGEKSSHAVQALECLTVLLRSLLIWTKEGPAARRAEAMAKADAGQDADDAAASTATSATGTKPPAADGGAAPVPSPAESVPATPGPGPSATPAGVPLVTSSSSLSMGAPPTGSKQGGARSTSRAAVATDLADDPAQFQHIKNVKQWILEGVDMFNYKPKKVRFPFEHRNGAVCGTRASVIVSLQFVQSGFARVRG